MVSQRQRLARKRFKSENPELFPKAEPTPPKDPNKKKKKKKSSAFKRKAESKPGSRNRHPLRVPGMKPGESCFICRAKDHIAKLCPEKTEWEKNKVFSSFALYVSLTLLPRILHRRLTWFVLGFCRYVCGVVDAVIGLRTAPRCKMPLRMSNIVITVGKLATLSRFVRTLFRKVCQCVSTFLCFFII